MSTHPRALDLVPDDVLDLLVEDAASGVADDAYAHIAPVLADPRLQSELHEVHLAAATASLAFADETDTEPMPDHLRLLCLGGMRAASQHLNDQPLPPLAEPEPLRFNAGRTPATTKTSSGYAGMLGWLAAAACLAVAVWAYWPTNTGPVEPSAGVIPVATSPAELRESLVQDAADLVTWRWKAWGPGYEDVTGDVVWSEQAQEGYMRLQGLPINDPNREQYQLWIVESSRGTPLETNPVDGGVFDIADTGELIVPIRAKLHSSDVVAFGVTREPPGGVVVSDRERLVVIAAPEQAAGPEAGSGD